MAVVMVAAVAASPVLRGLEVGQSIQFVSRIDCQITSDEFDLNGAPHSSRMAGANSITFLFPAAPPDDPKAKCVPVIPVVELDTSSDGSTYLSNVEARMPAPATLHPPIFLSEGEARLMTMTPREGSKDWDYESTQIAVHGATITEKGVCKLNSEADAQ
jgi:hypothetical protein